MIKMRSILDPKRHYKTEDVKAQTPEFSQIGTIIEGPTDFYSSRLLNNALRKTFAGEVLAMEAMERSTGRFCSKFIDVQLAATTPAGKPLQVKSWRWRGQPDVSVGSIETYNWQQQAVKRPFIRT